MSPKLEPDYFADAVTRSQAVNAVRKAHPKSDAFDVFDAKIGT